MVNDSVYLPFQKRYSNRQADTAAGGESASQRADYYNYAGKTGFGFDKTP